MYDHHKRRPRRANHLITTFLQFHISRLKRVRRRKHIARKRLKNMLVIPTQHSSQSEDNNQSTDTSDTSTGSSSSSGSAMSISTQSSSSKPPIIPQLHPTHPLLHPLLRPRKTLNFTSNPSFLTLMSSRLISALVTMSLVQTQMLIQRWTRTVAAILFLYTLP